VIKINDLESRISEIEALLHQGKSVNQIMRIIKCPTDKTVRMVISKYPHLREISLRNGKASQQRSANATRNN
jgi:hypothetical protein